MIRAVIFDLDGVIVNPWVGGIESYQKALVAGGYKKPTKAAVHRLFHLPAEGTLKSLTGQTDPAEIKRLIKLLSEADETETKTGSPKNCASVIKKLSHSYKLAIVSHSPKKRVRKLLRLAKVLKHFKVIVPIEDFKNPKPHPESLLIAARRLGVKPSDSVYVGDRYVDIEAANSAGMKSIGFLGFVEHRLPKADFETRRFASIPLLIKKLDAR
jgi:HAD superfamily hydrolase (TIGR01509 family)